MPTVRKIAPLGPGQPPPEPWPDPPEGWRWNRNGAPAHLIAPDGWKTHDYNNPERALAEAQRRILSQPKPAAPGSPLTNPDLDDALLRLRAAGYDVTRQGMHWAVRPAGKDSTILKGDEVLALAQSFPAPAPAPMPPGSSDGTLPLLDLVAALDDHAAGLPTPLPINHRIPLPSGLPDRLAAPLDLVVPGRYQPRTRFDQAKLDELAASIQEHGILTALKAFANERGQLELIAGERRLRAARQIGLAFVPVELCSYTLRQIAEISMVDNLERADLSPVEEGAMFERLITDLEISEAELARRISRNRAYIQQRRGIATAASAIVEALDDGIITFSQARGICLGAPHHAAAQIAALGALKSRGSWQGPATEADAKGYADEAVLTSSKDALAALGWTVKRTSIGSGKQLTIVYTDRVRPAGWTSAEILAALQEQRRPPVDGDVPPAAEIRQADRDALAVRGWQVDASQLKPWLLVTAGKTKFLHAGELAPIVQQATQDMADLQARYTKAGWALTCRTKGRDDFSATTKEGRKEHPWSWGTAAQLIKKIEAGKEAKTPNTVVRACELCKQQKPVSYEFGHYSCADCLKLLRAEEQRTRAHLRAQIQAASDWLAAAPDRVCRLLIAGLVEAPNKRLDIKQYANLDQKAAAVRAADVGTLRTVLLDVLEQLAYRTRGMDLGGGHHIGAAAPPADLVAAFAASDAADANPLLDLSERLTDIELWITERTAGDGTRLEVFSLQRTSLETIGEEIDDMADDDGISDEAFEDLTHRIGRATEQLLALAEIGPAPQLAEVGA